MTTTHEDTSRPVEVKRYPPGKHPNTLAAGLKNLKPYKPGENGHGRVYPLKERLRHALDKPTSFLDEEPKSIGDAMVRATLKGALDLIPSPFHETWDRVEGKVKDETPPVSQDNRVINIIVIDNETKDLIARIKDRTGPQASAEE